jgi:hypothetical protein
MRPMRSAKTLTGLDTLMMTLSLQILSRTETHGSRFPDFHPGLTLNLVRSSRRGRQSGLSPLLRIFLYPAPGTGTARQWWSSAMAVSLTFRGMFGRAREGDPHILEVTP